MRELKNRITVTKEDDSTIDIVLGGLYIITRDYRARNVHDFDDCDILIAMPVAITSEDIWLYTICTNCGDGIYVSGRDDKSIIITNDHTDYDKQISVSRKVPPEHLEALLKQMPMREHYVANVGRWDLEVYVMAMQCVKADFIGMNITSLDIKITDIRQWPKGSIEWWARYHLRLGPEQLNAISGFNERWKMIAYAQEVFTYHCAEFNPVANKVMEKNRKKQKDAQVERMMNEMERVKQNGYADHNGIFRPNDDYVIEVGNIGFINEGPGGVDNFRFVFTSRDDGANRRVELNKSVRARPDGNYEAEISCHVEGRQHAIEVSGGEIREEDMVILYMDGHFLHISLDAADMMPRMAMPDPGEPIKYVKYDDNGRPFNRTGFMDPRDRGKRIPEAPPQMHYFTVDKQNRVINVDGEAIPEVEAKAKKINPELIRALNMEEEFPEIMEEEDGEE